MSDVVEIEIPIRIDCELTDGWGGERWDIIEVKDERTNEEIGDIGIYDFDAYSDFPEALMNAVIGKTCKNMVASSRKSFFIVFE